jgi:hypothetical protein
MPPIEPKCSLVDVDPEWCPVGRRQDVAVMLADLAVSAASRKTKANLRVLLLGEIARAISADANLAPFLTRDKSAHVTALLVQGVGLRGGQPHTAWVMKCLDGTVLVFDYSSSGRSSALTDLLAVLAPLHPSIERLPAREWRHKDMGQAAIDATRAVGRKLCPAIQHTNHWTFPPLLPSVACGGELVMELFAGSATEITTVRIPLVFTFHSSSCVSIWFATSLLHCTSLQVPTAVHGTQPSISSDGDAIMVPATLVLDDGAQAAPPKTVPLVTVGKSNGDAQLTTADDDPGQHNVVSIYIEGRGMVTVEVNDN